MGEPLGWQRMKEIIRLIVRGIGLVYLLLVVDFEFGSFRRRCWLERIRQTYIVRGLVLFLGTLLTLSWS